MKDFYKLEGDEIDEILDEYKPLKIARPKVYDAMEKTLNNQKKMQKKMEREEACSVLASIGGGLCYYGSETGALYLEEIGAVIALTSGIALLKPKLKEGTKKLKKCLSNGDEETLDYYL